jgi:hypothetical protein
MKRAEDVTMLRSFDIKFLHLQPSSAQNAELKRLDELDRKAQ